MSDVVRLGIIICDRYRDCAGGKCFRALRAREGAFSAYAGRDVELVGFTSCGGCPGGNIEYAPEEMKKNGAEVVHLATGFVVGYPPCPHLDHFLKFIPEKYGLQVVVGTHPSRRGPVGPTRRAAHGPTRNGRRCWPRRCRTTRHGSPTTEATVPRGRCRWLRWGAASAHFTGATGPSIGTTMRICIPVLDDCGLESPICEHFGSSPAFMLVDTETGACRAVSTHNLHREHGACAPLTTLFDLGVDAFVVAGIGRGALGRIAARGAQVFRGRHATVGETLQAFRTGTLRPVSLDEACAGHGHGHGHEHDHGHHHGHGHQDEQGVCAPGGHGNGDR